jgi:hypothetical protein
VNRSSKWILFGLGAMALGVMLISVACGTSSSSSKTTEMRVVHLVPDEQQPLEMLIDNKSIFSSIAYGVPTAFANITAVNHDLKINLSSTNLLDSPAEPFTAGTSYTYLIIGSTGAGVSIQGNKLTDDHTLADKGMFKLRMVNGSPNSGPVDVYIVAPSTDFNVSPPVTPTIGGLASNTPSTYQSLASGSYDIYVTPPGDQTCITNPKQPPPPVPPLPYPPTCLINLDGRNNTAVPAFQAGQNRTLIMLNQVPGGGSYTTLPLLNDLN